MACMQLNGRVAVITGASSGIGLEFARQMAAQGVAVVLGARRKQRLDDAVHEIRERGGRAEALVTDVTREEDVAALVARAQEAFGRLDVMVCNAGFGYYGTVEETPSETMRRMMDVNFMGTFYGARAALPTFRAAGRGHLLIVSSVVGLRGIPMMSAYSATKAAQVTFAEALRSEFFGTDIHVSVVYPVSTETEFKQAIERDYGHRISGLGPAQSVEEVARAMVECVKRPRAEVHPHIGSRALSITAALAPRLTDRAVRRFGRRREVR